MYTTFPVKRRKQKNPFEPGRHRDPWPSFYSHFQPNFYSQQTKSQSARNSLNRTTEPVWDMSICIKPEAESGDTKLMASQ